jgi:UDP-glucuronate 4-epimerase
MKILVTGCAGFIGYHLTKKLLLSNNIVYGVDNLNNYYSVDLKKDRLNHLIKISSDNKKNFFFKKIDLTENSSLNFLKDKIDYVIHLAAQAGVRYSLRYPRKYVETNINGFFNVLEFAKNKKVKKFIFASTSSVYGNNKNLPSKETHKTSNPLQIYAATKAANELMAHSYSNLYNLTTIGLRFFTVYGPSSRPDMSLFKFAKNIINDKPIEVFNHGNHSRDFTYVEDIIESINRLIKIKSKKLIKKDIPHEIYNIGSNRPIKLMKFIQKLEKYLGKKSKKKFLNLQKGDIIDTYADSSKLHKAINFKPHTSIDEGVKNFCEWFLKYNKK